MEDPGIKLFGKKILLPEISKTINLPAILPTTAGEESTGGCGDNGGGSYAHNCFEGERAIREVAEKDQLKPRSPPKALAETDNPKTPSINEETRTEESEPKTMKKPDKILPCPRCTSMDTKFCYYNNYNVNQPRHFCKSCQRYWTAGGAMRNMPVGAGRRKTKNSTSLCRYITVSQEPFQTAQIEVVATSDSVPENSQDKSSLHSEVHSVSGVSWPYNPWSSSTIPITAICPPIPVYPSAYWNCFPFLPPSMPAQQARTSYPCDQILGKHSRDDDVSKEPNDCDDHLKKQKNSVLVPKTLRIDDPDEAAKSSIWATLGIKNENFKVFQEKGEAKKKNQVTTTSPALQANPAAFSRSLCFQETV